MSESPELEAALKLLEEFRVLSLELIAKAKTPEQLEAARVLLIGRERGLLNGFKGLLGGSR